MPSKPWSHETLAGRPERCAGAQCSRRSHAVPRGGRGEIPSHFTHPTGKFFSAWLFIASYSVHLFTMAIFMMVRVELGCSDKRIIVDTTAMACKCPCKSST